MLVLDVGIGDVGVGRCYGVVSVDIGVGAGCRYW